MSGSASTTRLSNNFINIKNKNNNPFLILTDVTEDIQVDFNKYKKLTEHIINIIAGHEHVFKIREDYDNAITIKLKELYGNVQQINRQQLENTTTEDIVHSIGGE